MKSPKKLNNLKLAFITGATKGIGRSTAITFANAGWDLILLSRNMDLMEKLKSELLPTKSKINLVKSDLSNPLEIEHCVKEAIEKYFSIASLTQCSISRGLDKSLFTRLIFDLVGNNSLFSFSIKSIFLESKIKSQPALAKVIAVDLPIPFVAPVIKASFKLFSFLGDFTINLFNIICFDKFT